MDFHELDAFIILARTLHFARAAAALHTSPSGLSRLLGRLEEELGVRLLERDTRRVELTEEGASFLAFAEESIRRRDEFRLSLDSGDGKLCGMLRVYASVTACYSILPPFVEAMHHDHPQLRLAVETGDPAGAENAVRVGRADLALAALPEGGYADLASFSVRRTPLVFVSSGRGPYGSLDLDGDKLLTQVMGTIPLVLPVTGLARARFDRWARTNGVKPHIAAETAGNEAILAFARLGLGLGLVPRIVLENSPFAEGLVQYDAGPGFGDYDIGFVLRPARGEFPADSGVGGRMKAAVTAILERVYPEGAWNA
jgi:LysR family positive regulator for ilvC